MSDPSQQKILHSQGKLLDINYSTMIFSLIFAFFRNPSPDPLVFKLKH